MDTFNTTELSDIGLRTQVETQPERANELGQADFLALLTTQLANQDPSSPVENEDFIAQLAQFSSVNSLQTLVDQFGSLSQSLTSNQALQASSLVGRNVLVSGDQGFLFEGTSGIAGQLNLDSSASNVRFEVRDASGQIVRSVDIGNQEAGDIDFVWDGLNDAGENLQSGLYTINAFGQINGDNQQLNTSIVSRVESVNLGNTDGQILINLSGLGQVNFNDIQQVG